VSEGDANAIFFHVGLYRRKKPNYC